MQNYENLIKSGLKSIIVFLTTTASYLIAASEVAHSQTIPLVDSIANTSADTSLADTASPKKKVTKDALEAPLKYTAKDSIYFDMENKKVYLYGDAQLTYQNIELKAAYVEFGMEDQTVYASGVKDSTGKEVGTPVFKEGNEEFKSHWLRYNFKTKKGFIYFVKTQQDNGTLIGDSTKRTPNGHVHLKGGSYSTCDLDHPHFYIGLTKAKSIPGDKIVSGPAYLVVADIPLPLVLPFGFFPNTKSYSSGVLIPTWGEEAQRGIFLRNGGYYFGISDYMDLRLTGDIYSKGSWGLNTVSNYRKRYRFSGNFNFSYYVNIIGEKGQQNYSEGRDFSLRWTHTQDAKANPNQTFSASVNYSSSKYDRYNSYNTNDYLTNTKSSSISYSYRWPNKPFNLNVGLNHTQNSQTQNVDLTMPNMTFNMNTIYPFRREDASDNLKWYENIQTSYNAYLTNNIHTKDSLMFTNRMFEGMENGFKHSIPLSTSFKLNKFTTLSPSLNYEGVAYSEYIEKRYVPYSPIGSDFGTTDTITYRKFKYAHSFYPSVSLNVAPKFYGMFQFTGSKVKAIRHVASPSVGFSFIPDIRDYSPNYYKRVYKGQGKYEKYSEFEGAMYGTPVPSSGKSANISMGLRNNIEMKYLSENDTSSEVKKVAILENLDFSSSYNVYADSMNFSSINMNAGTHFIGDKINIQFSSSFDPYIEDSLGRRRRFYEWSTNRRIGRLTNASLSIGTSFKSGAADSKSNNNQPQNNNLNQANNNFNNTEFTPNIEVNYDIPWSLNVNYDWSYSKSGKNKSYTQTVRVNGDLSLTKKWKIGFNTGYDIEAKKMSFTNITISRDLHCWEMRFNIVPFGERKSYFFEISAKAPILRDLKYNKQKSWYDNF